MSIYSEKLPILNTVFTPRAPIEDRRIFSGRIQQLAECLDLIEERGAHGILYGERGVGKTSVSNIVRLILKKYSVAKCSCDSNDSFSSLWKKVFEEIFIPHEIYDKSIGFKSNIKAIRKENYRLADILGEIQLTAQNVIKYLNYSPKPLVIIIDEFDRLPPNFDKRLFADTIKNISDNSPDITFMIVGVGDSVAELIGEHASIERNLKQIHLPVMTNEELMSIIDTGLKELKMKMDHVVKQNIVEFSCGYPHYTHLLAYNSCKISIVNGKLTVNENHFNKAVEVSIKEAHESLRLAYQKATLATKKNIFKEVLWACSVSSIDENGTFQAMDLEYPLSSILGKEMKVNQFGYHIAKFCGSERGNILIQIGVPKRQRYKFSNPLMRAFVRLEKYASFKSI
jgi:Cdc6-like AAA superfamily ATPase